MPKHQLKPEEELELKNWLSTQKINPLKMHREYSDAVAMAQLLKKFHPKLIDLHNYPPRNSTKLKIINWETLNNKVLAKLGLQQNKNVIEKLARCQPGAIEMVLNEIRLMEKSANAKDAKNDEQEQIWSENDEVMVVTVNKRIGDAIVQVPQKMILYSIYEQTLRESYAKDSYLNASQQKIAHLENILKLKAERIDELCAQLAKLSVRTLLKQHNLENSSSNNSGLHMVEQFERTTTSGGGGGGGTEPCSKSFDS